MIILRLVLYLSLIMVDSSSCNFCDCVQLGHIFQCRPVSNQCWTIVQLSHLFEKRQSEGWRRASCCIHHLCRLDLGLLASGKGGAILIVVGFLTCSLASLLACLIETTF